MPSSFAGTRLGLITTAQTPTAALTLSITTGSISLIQTGLQDLVVQDNLGNTVTGCTIVVTDTSKCTASGQRLTGVGSSGSTTVYASKAGYNDSTTVTITCTGGVIRNQVVGVGGNTTTDGQALNSWTDQGTGAQTFTESTSPPTYKTGGVNSQPYVLFTSASVNLLSSPSTTAYNTSGGSGDFCYLIEVQMTSTSPAGNERIIAEMDTVNFRGCRITRTTTNNIQLTTGSGASQTNLTTTYNGFTGAAAHYILIECLNAGGRTIYIDGTSRASDSTACRDLNTSFVHRIGVDDNGSSNPAGMNLYRIRKISRAITSTERTQLFLSQSALLGL